MKDIEFGGRRCALRTNLDAEDVVKEMNRGSFDHLMQGSDLEKLNCEFEFLENSKSQFFKDPLYYWRETKEPWEENCWTLKNRADKDTALAQCEAWLRARHATNLVQSALKIVEEQLMNAVKDAPMIAERLGLEAAQDPKKREVRLHCLSSNVRIALACEDFFGLLEPREVIARLDQIVRDGVRDSMRMDSAQGAGLGCFLMYQESQDLVFAVERNRRTIVACVLPAEPSMKKRSGFLKNIHLIY